MRVYFDACVLSRLSDDKNQPIIAKEAAAILTLLQLVFLGEISWFASPVLRREIELNPNQEKRDNALSLLSYAESAAIPIRHMRLRAEALMRVGYGVADSLHLACAESLKVDVLLTTDDRFFREQLGMLVLR